MSPYVSVSKIGGCCEALKGVPAHSIVNYLHLHLHLHPMVGLRGARPSARGVNHRGHRGEAMLSVRKAASRILLGQGRWWAACGLEVAVRCLGEAGLRLSLQRRMQPSFGLGVRRRGIAEWLCARRDQSYRGSFDHSTRPPATCSPALLLVCVCFDVHCDRSAVDV